MSFLLTPYTAVLVAASFVSGTVIVLSLRQWAIPGNRLFTLMVGAVFVWTFASGLESAAVAIPLKIVFAKISFLGTSSVGPLLLLFSLSYGRGDVRMPWLGPLLLSIWPAASAIILATNELHGLMWTDVVPSGVAGSNMVSFIHTPLFYAAIGYDALLSVAAAYILLRAVLRSHRLFRSQLFTVVASIVVFWVSFVLYIPPLNPMPGLDTVAVGFSVSGFLLLMGIQRYRLLDVAPIARDVLVEKLADGLVVLDAQDRIVDINPTARGNFSLTGRVVGRHVSEVFPSWSALLAEAGEQPDRLIEARHPSDESVFYDLRVSRFSDSRGVPAGRLLVIRDVTERRRIELEKERLITELQEAVTDIRTLRGLLPICANCRKVRDDSGYWRHLESYVQEHSEAQFSHSLCPDCMRTLYPDLADKEEKPPGSGSD